MTDLECTRICKMYVCIPRVTGGRAFGQLKKEQESSLDEFNQVM